jgi:uncharacterized membrane protein YkoI
MMKKTWKWLACGAALALAVVAGSGAVAPAADNKAALAARLAKNGDILPLEQILQHAQAVQPGKVIETEFEHKRGRYIYEVEVLDDKGVVWKLKLDAKTGALIGAKQEDD